MNSTELLIKKSPEDTSVVLHIPPMRIVPNPSQPRHVFDSEALDSLTDSIRRVGVICPLVVRRIEDSYELIAGERRLRAAMAAGLETVPCILRDADFADSAELAIIENLQREDLSMFEEAEAIRSLLTTCGLTQESAAARLSCSQSYVANKLRLLKLPERQRRRILEGGLTERHARALLRLSSDEERDEIIEIIVKRHMNVAAAEEYIENYLCARERDRLREKADRLDRDFKRKLLSKDMRLFYNSIDRAVDSVRSCGIGIETNRRITDEGTVIEILVKNRA